MSEYDNTILYWNNYFSQGFWDKYNGKLQTKFFAKTIIENLPSDIFSEIFNTCKTVVDFGCAFGQLCEVFSEAFINTKIIGLDFSNVAIETCKKLYPKLTFRTSPLQPNIDKFDLLVCSNTLEHLYNYLEYVKLFTRVVQKYIILLVPYKSEILREHVVSFNDNSFPVRIDEFERVFEITINCWNSGFWNGDQLLMVYKRV